MNTRLMIIVEVPTFDKEDRIKEHPLTIANYFLDNDCDDPTFALLSARWLSDKD